MSTPIEIEDCIGPRPEFFMDNYKGSIVIYGNTWPVMLVLGKSGPWMQKDQVKMMLPSWVENAYPPRLLPAGSFFEN